MRFYHAGVALLFLVLNLWTVAANVAAATSPSADSTTAKKQAEAKSYMFVSSHDEIIAKAKKRVNFAS